MSFLGGSVVKSLPTNAEDRGSIPRWGISPGGESGNHSNILAWEILRIEDTGGLQSMGSQKSCIQLCN